MLPDVSKNMQVVVAIKIFGFPVDEGGVFVLQKYVCNVSDQHRCAVQLGFHLGDMKHLYKKWAVQILSNIRRVIWKYWATMQLTD